MPTVEASTTAKNLSDATSLTKAVTVPSGLSNSAVVVAGTYVGAAGDPGALSTITFGGAALTAINNSGASYRTILYYGLLPPAGSQNLQMNWSANGRADVAIIILSGVLQSGPVGTLAGNTALSLGSIACNLTDLLIEVLVSQGDTSPATPGAGQTSILADAVAGSGSYGAVGVSSKVPGSTSETVSWASIGGVISAHKAIPFIAAPASTFKPRVLIF